MATNSRVTIGPAPNQLITNFDDGSSTTEHRIKVTGLTPFTRYFYSVGSTSAMQSGADSNHRFKTAPVPGSVQPIRVWAIGDFGKGNTEQGQVRDAYLNFIDGKHTDMWVWLGDNAYDDGTDSEYQSKVFDPVVAYGSIMPYMHFHPTPGNHDYNSVTNLLLPPSFHGGPYYDIVEVFENGEGGGVPSNSEIYYSYDYGNVHFIAITSEEATLTGALGSLPSDMSNWFIADIQANTLPWVIVYFHAAPYTKGSHDSDNPVELLMAAMRDDWTPMFDQYGVDLVLTGHSHVYERSMLIKGHTGFSFTFGSSNIVDGGNGHYGSGQAYLKPTFGQAPNEGVVYAVAGNSGSHDDNPDLNHPVHVASDGGPEGYGSLALEIHANRLDAWYINKDSSIRDEFTIFKGHDCSFPTHLHVTQITPNSARLNWDQMLGADHYIIRGRPLGGTNWVTLPIPQGAPNFKLVSGLNLGVSYEWQMQTICDPNSGLMSYWSPLNRFTIEPQMPCPTPLGLSTAPVSATAGRLNWLPVPGASGYLIEGRLGGGVGWPVSITINGGNTNHKDVFGLNPNQGYEWRIISRCSGFFSQPSAVQVFITGSSGRFLHHAEALEWPTILKTGELDIYPNPVSGKARIEWTGEAQISHVKIYDLSGRLVQLIPVNEANFSLLETSWMENGIYLATTLGSVLFSGRFEVRN